MVCTDFISPTIRNVDPTSAKQITHDLEVDFHIHNDNIDGTAQEPGVEEGVVRRDEETGGQEMGVLRVSKDLLSLFLFRNRGGGGCRKGS